LIAEFIPVIWTTPVPWSLIQTRFRGKRSLTHAINDIFEILLVDSVWIAGDSSDQSRFNKIDLNSCFSLIFDVNYHKVIPSNGIKVYVGIWLTSNLLNGIILIISR
jgi:hypothetical protein